jgi:predicted transcriptional regulator
MARTTVTVEIDDALLRQLEKLAGSQAPWTS